MHFALQQFPGSPKYRSLPKSIQADVKAFFGNHTTAQDQRRAQLFETGNREKIRSAIANAAEAHFGAYRGERWFRCRATTLARLPTNLRILIGCAEVLQGGVEACDFVDIDLETPRIAMLTCDDVEQEIPFMIERVTVDLVRLKVSAAKFDGQMMPIYFKSRFLLGDAPDLNEQLEAERKLFATGLFEPGMPEPSWERTSAALRA